MAIENLKSAGQQAATLALAQERGELNPAQAEVSKGVSEALKPLSTSQALAAMFHLQRVRPDN